MRTSARALGVDAEFLYLPGCMICYFNEPVLQQTSVDLVRNGQGVDLGKFKEVYNVYKCVIHAKYNPEDALRDIEEIKKRSDQLPKLVSHTSIWRCCCHRQSLRVLGKTHRLHTHLLPRNDAWHPSASGCATLRAILPRL